MDSQVARKSPPVEEQAGDVDGQTLDEVPSAPSLDAFQNSTISEEESANEQGLGEVPSAPNLENFRNLTLDGDIHQNFQEHRDPVTPPSAPPLISHSADQNTIDSTDFVNESETKCYKDLQHNLSHMEPHLMLRNDLKDMESAPSAPLLDDDHGVYGEVSDQLAYMEPHGVLRNDLAAMKDQNNENEKTKPVEENSIRPFTERQLLSFYKPNLGKASHNDAIVDVFLASQENMQKSELHELLLNYLRVRSSFRLAEKNLDSKMDTMKELKEKVWTLRDEEIQEQGECQDEKKVSTVYKFMVAEFNAPVASNLHASFKDIKETLVEPYTRELYKAELKKKQIDDFIFNVIEKHNIEIIRTSINVLFSFHRRLVRDDKFFKDVRFWLDQLVAVILANEDPADDLFLLNHVMRCPGGVGEWGACYIQPKSPSLFETEAGFDNPQLGHLLTVLATVMLPVRKREEFLTELKVSASPAHFKHSDDRWTVIDSEGEEDEDPEHSWAKMRENDLVAILNQVPICEMFKYILKVERRDGADFYDPSLSSEHSFLTLFAFSTSFVNILREGLKTFNTPRYRNFAKRLGQLIRQTVEFVSDHWQAFKSKKSGYLHPAMEQRIQIEYDTFFLRAIRSIFSAQKQGAWQYLALIPYGTISIETLWQIFYVLHLDLVDDEENYGSDVKDWNAVFSDPDLNLQLQDKLLHAADTERHYLLTAFSAMAVSRSDNDTSESAFIKWAALDIFAIGFVSDFTDDGLAKCARDLLIDISTHHPFVLSILVHQFENPVVLKACGLRSFYLVTDLPFSLWRPSEEDFQLLLTWIQEYPLSTELSQIARIILSRMDWSCKEQDGTVLSYDFHKRLAISIVKTGLKYAPDTISSGILESSVRQVSNLAASVVRQSPEQLFTLWAWETITKLHLHSVDQNDKTSIQAVAGYPEAFSRTLDFDLSQELEEVVEGVMAKNPLACFVALMTTQIGHSIPEICSRGFDHLNVLAASGRLDHVMECLQNITPLFLNDPNTLCKEEGFKSTLSAITSADQTLYKIAKELIVSDSPGPVMKEFMNMLQKQMLSFKRYGLEDSSPVGLMWLEVFTSVPSWFKDKNVLYVIDLICREAFFNQNLYLEVQSKLTCIQEDLIAKSEEKYFSWFSGSSCNGVTLIPSSSEFIYLAFFVLDIAERHEEKLGIWPQLVEELSSESTTVDSAAKNVAKKLKLLRIDTNSLSIYRWSRQLLDTPDYHEMNVIFAQRFFSFFFSRPKPDEIGHEGNSIGPRFFEGLVNSRYFRQIKLKISSIASYYENNSSNSEQNNAKLLLFKTFIKWLEDESLLLGTLHIASLAPSFMPQKLADVIGQEKTLWLEYTSSEETEAEQRKNARDWEKLHFRLPMSPTSKKSPVREVKPENNIVRRLQNFDIRPDPPKLMLRKSPIPRVTDPAEIQIPELKAVLENLLNELRSYSNDFSVSSMELASLISTYMEKVPQLYETSEREVLVKVPCSGTTGPKREKYDCMGHACIMLNFREAKQQDAIAYQIKRTEDHFHALIQKMRQPMPESASRAIAHLEKMIQLMLKSFAKYHNKRNVMAHILNLGLTFFYELTDLLHEDLNSCTVLRHFLSLHLETLGNNFIAGDPRQCEPLLHKILEIPSVAQFLTPSFTPDVADCEAFLRMYTQINSMAEADVNVTFVLLSKMSVEIWLRSSPAVLQRSKLISQISRALRKTGAKPADSRTLLHGLHKQHLLTLAFFDFPKHYVEVQLMLLTLTEEHSLDPQVWFDVINYILNFGCQGILEIKAKLDGTKEGSWAPTFRDFAINQKEFQIDEAKEMVEHFTRHFKNERRIVGLHGLYTKYRDYVSPLAALMMLNGFLYVKLLEQNDTLSQTYTPADKLVSKAWSLMSNLYSSWLYPMSESDREEVATWIKELATDKQVLLPWAPGESSLATIVFNSFVKVCTFIDASLPAELTIMNMVWEMYAQTFANSKIRDYVHEVVHQALLQLPWEMFAPTLRDVELMSRIADTYLPTCHGFLGKIFVNIAWKPILERESGRAVVPLLLRLLVKLAAEPSVRQLGQLQAFLREYEHLPWWLIDPVRYESIIQWYVMSADCRVVINHKDRHPIDAAILKLLRVGAGHSPEMMQSSSPDFSLSNPGNLDALKQKRLNYVRCCVKHFLSCANKHKNFLATHQDELKAALKSLLENTELCIIMTVPLQQQLDHSMFLMRDILGILNANASSVLPVIALEVFCKWLSQHTHQSPMVQAVLKHMGVIVSNPPMLAKLAESTLEAYFADEDTDETGGEDFKITLEQNGGDAWNFVLHTVSLPTDQNKLTTLLDSAVKEGLVLVLYLHLRKKLPKCLSLQDESVIVATILEWLRHLRYSEKVEPKLCLLYVLFFHLLQRQLDFNQSNEKFVVKSLLEFVDILYPMASGSGGGWNLLGVIGFGSQYKMTPRARFLALSLVVFVRSQINGANPKEMKLLKPDARPDIESEMAASPLLASAQEELSSLKAQKAFLGLEELIDWVLTTTSDPMNDFRTIHEFITYLVKDKLYVEKYLYVKKAL